MTMLTQALALTKSKTEPTCDHEFVDDDPEFWLPGICIHCDTTYAESLRGFGSNVQQLGRGVRRVPRA